MQIITARNITLQLDDDGSGDCAETQVRNLLNSISDLTRGLDGSPSFITENKNFDIEVAFPSEEEPEDGERLIAAYDVPGVFEDEKFTRAEWRKAVADEKTDRGYLAWVEDKTSN